MAQLAYLPKLLAIVGPTASGKTDLAVALAKELGGEIISADSRQFYKGTDIGSDIIPGRWVKKGARRVYVARGIPHHLIAFRSPKRPVTAAEFKTLAEKLIRDISRRGRVPILAGGTGLYLRAVIDNFTIPEVPPNPRLRARLAERSPGRLYSILKKLDPVYAGRIPPANRRYVTRALEVIAATGKPFSAQQGRAEPLFDVLELGIRRPRREIYRRIELRIDDMLKRGLLKEAARLGRRYGWSVPSLTGLGHRQLGEYLNGRTTLEEAIRQIKRDTRHFAKRQLTWFRRDKRIHWVKGASPALKLARTFLREKKGR